MNIENIAFDCRQLVSVNELELKTLRKLFLVRFEIAYRIAMNVFDSSEPLLYISWYGDHLIPVGDSMVDSIGRQGSLLCGNKHNFLRRVENPASVHSNIHPIYFVVVGTLFYAH